MSASNCLALALLLAAAGCSAPDGFAAARASEATDAEREVARPRAVPVRAEVPAEPAGGGGAGPEPVVEPEPPATGGAPALPDTCEPHRPVLVTQVSNARDLGGTPLTDGQTVACGVVYRGAPLAFDDAGCTVASQLALTTVVDLRVESEQLSRPDAACLGTKQVSAPLPIPYGLAAADYLNVLHETASIAAAFHTFADPGAYPIYFHCTYGRDRTGVVGALLLLAVGASRETVMQEYLLSQPNVGAYPDSLTAVLDEIEQRGGAEQVLLDAGLSSAELALIRASVIARE